MKPLARRLGVCVLLSWALSGCVSEDPPAPDEELRCNVVASMSDMDSVSVCLHLKCTGATCTDNKPTCESLEDDMNRVAASGMSFALEAVTSCAGELTGIQTDTRSGNLATTDCYSTAGDANGQSLCEGIADQ